VAKPVQVEVVDHATYTGRFEALTEVTLQANVSGYLTEILFVDSPTVEAGAPLFVIDTRPFDAAVAATRAELDRAQAALRLAELDLARAEDLVLNEVVSQQTADDALTTYESTKAGVAAAEAALRSAPLDRGCAEISALIGGRM